MLTVSSAVGVRASPKEVTWLGHLTASDSKAYNMLIVSPSEGGKSLLKRGDLARIDCI